MLRIYSGIPGTCKTLHCVSSCLSSFKKENSYINYYLDMLSNFIVRKYDILSYFIIHNYRKLLVYISHFYILHISRYFSYLFKFRLFKLVFLIICLFYRLLFKLVFLIIRLFYRLLFKFIVNVISNRSNRFIYRVSNGIKVGKSFFTKFLISPIYSNFPILLSKKYNIYSNSCSVFDLDNRYSFIYHSTIIIDEIQLFIDSDEYADVKQKVRIAKIGKFLQSHRHFGIKDIIFVSQHPSRVFKKARNITESYLEHKGKIVIPLFPIGLMYGTYYYTFESYGMPIPKDRESKNRLSFKYKPFFKFFNLNKCYNSYDSCYLYYANCNKPLKEGSYKNLRLDITDLDNL